MGHFSYKHLPAKGVGHRDPRRPHVTGGLGMGLPVFISDILEKRIYQGRGRDLMVKNRQLLEQARDLIGRSRYYDDRTELVPIYVNPASDVMKAGWLDSDYGNGDGFIWDELAGDGFIDSYITDAGVGIPGYPVQSSVAFIVATEAAEDPGTDKDHFLTLRAEGLMGTSAGMEVTAYIGSPTNTIIKTIQIDNTDGGWVKYRFPLTEAEAALLDYTSIWLYLIVSDLPYDPDTNPEHGVRLLKVDYIRLEIPSYKSTASRYRARLDRILDGIGRTLSALTRRYGGGGRDMGSENRDLE